jgi:uncharacterized membrane protein
LVVDARVPGRDASAGAGGSLADSVVGALFQASILDKERCVVLSSGRSTEAALQILRTKGGERFEHICGLPVLSNDAVNLATGFIATLLGAACAPILFP